MISKNEIETIECLFEQYSRYQSEIMFNYQTDRFFDNLFALEFAREVLDGLVEKNRFDTEVFIEHGKIEWFSFYKEIISHGHEYYLSYCLHYYNFLRSQDNPFEPYFDEIIWVDKSATEIGDRQTLFKTDFVRPIIDYVINAYSAENHIIHLIKRYCEKVERFKELVGVTDEKEIQKQFAKFLFENGCNFHRESNTNNGQIDFYIESQEGAMRSAWDCNAGQYIVEVKVFNNVNQIQLGMSQLLSYTHQCHAHGCLLIFTKKEIIFENVPVGIMCLSAYIGEETPSRRGKITNIDFREKCNPC